MRSLLYLTGRTPSPFPAEPEHIKESLRQRGPAMVFGYLGERNLYIPTRENVRLDLYQSQSLRVQYACPVGWSLDVEEEMVKGALAAVGAEPAIDFRKQKSYPLRQESEVRIQNSE